MGTKYIVSLGEILFDINLKKGLLTLGGAPSNWAIDCHRLITDKDIQTVIISGIGKDQFGITIKEILKNCINPNGQPVNRLLAELPDKPTGTVNVTYDKTNNPQYEIVTNVAWDNIGFENASPEEKALLDAVRANCCAVCWGTLGQRESVSRQFIQQFVQSITAPDALKVYDPNLREEINAITKDIIHQSLKLANTVKLSHDEVDKIGAAFGYYNPVNNKSNENKGEREDYDERSRILFEKYSNINTLIITLSTRGSYIYTRKGDFSFMGTEVVEDAKAVGCGDSFLAGVIASLVSGKDLVYAHEKGTAVSRFVAQNDSATPELPEELGIK